MNSLVVQSNGNVCACLDLTDPHTVLGNVKKQSIDEIWNSDNGFLQMLRNSSLKDLTFCRDCIHFKYCKGGCPASAYDVWGDYNMPDLRNCMYFTMAREQLTLEPVDEIQPKDRTYIIRCDK
jgi:radical SAM protein with 4Fe4S-binding SPASM domain